MRYKAVDSVVIGVAMLAVLFSSGAVLADSPSELLEKAIYTEESVGDLPAAVKLYEKAVAEGKKVEAVAAKAQYRLGLCLLKQKKTAAAEAVFKKLVEAYPDQKDWVTKAKKHLPDQAGLTLGEVPWKDGEFMQLAIKLGGGSRQGAMVWSVDPAKLAGKDVCRMTLHRYGGEMQSGVSHVESDAATSRPIKSVFRNGMLGNAEAEYTPGGVFVTTHTVSGQSVRKDKLDKVYYDQEEACQILRRLPLATGYKGDLPIYVPLGMLKMNLAFEVVGKETLDVPAGKFECYKVPLPKINQTLWYSTDANHYLVQLEAGGGAALIQLEQLGLNKPGEMRTCKNDQMGCSFSVPAGWYFYETTSGDGPKNFLLLDPEEVAINFVGVWKKVKKDDDQTDGKKAVRAFAEEGVAARVKDLKDYKIRPDSWKEFTVGGLPAISVVGDYLAGQRKKTDYSVHVLGQTTKAQLRASACDPDKLDGLRTEFDKIVDTLKIK